jgi:hypothetical protein
MKRNEQSGKNGTNEETQERMEQMTKEWNNAERTKQEGKKEQPRKNETIRKECTMKKRNKCRMSKKFRRRGNPRQTAPGRWNGTVVELASVKSTKLPR